MIRKPSSLLLLLALPCALSIHAPAQDKPAATWSAAQQQGLQFLATKQQDGVFSVEMRGRSFPDAGFTSLALSALQSKPAAQRTKEEQAIIDKGCAWVLTQQNEDGSFGRNVPNYTTCAAVGALSRWDPERSKDALAKAQRFVLALQNCETNGSSKSDVEYGGVGYGSKGERSDLSNLQFSISALRQSGLQSDHEAFARAVQFLQRTQNLTPSNDLAGKVQVKTGEGETAPLGVGNDGGAVYYPGESPAGYVDNPDKSRTPRSYGSMTYALLKAYTLCGLPGDDARVQAAVRWIGANWTVTENPGADPKLPEKTKYQGLFYYYMLLAQALDAASIEKVEVKGEGGKVQAVDWRQDLRKQVEGMQRKDGSWLNDKNDRWYEGMDILCTCYAMLALEHCK